MNFYFALPARRADFRSAVSRRCFFYVFALLGALSFFTASARAQSSYQLNTVFVNKGSAGLSAVQGDVTIQKTTTPAHKSNNVETREYDGYFQAWSNSSKLALLSDDGTTVTIDGVRVLDKAGRGQGFDEPNAQTFDTLNASFQIGRIYHIHLSYSNTIHRNDADV